MPSLINILVIPTKLATLPLEKEVIKIKTINNEDLKDWTKKYFTGVIIGPPPTLPSLKISINLKVFISRKIHIEKNLVQESPPTTLAVRVIYINTLFLT